MSIIKINNIDINFEGEKTILELARENNIVIPALCYLKECYHKGICGLCLIKIKGKNGLFHACSTKAENGLIVSSEDEEVKEEVKKAVSKILDNHDFKCGTCKRKENCELFKLVIKTRAKANKPYILRDEEWYFDKRSEALHLNRNRCIKCGRCVAMCKEETGTKSIIFHDLENGERVVGARELKCFDDTGCLLCGQCLTVCPVDALGEKSHIELVEEALNDKNKHVIVAMAPAVRTAVGEMFNMGFGVDTTGKIYTALRMIGFDKIFDINFGADATIMEEAAEFIDRILNGGTLPMFTSCCPGWIRLVEHYFPELIPNLSTTKSPQQIFGAASKNYYPHISGVKPEEVFTVTIMPCISKKFEMYRPEMENEGIRNIDAVLTTKELGQMIKKRKIDFKNLEDSNVDEAMGMYSGAGVIFGATGGVLEAGLRTAADILEGRDIPDVDYTEVRGFQGIKESVVTINGKQHRVAVVNGAKNFFKFVEEGNLQKGYSLVEVMDCPGGCINGGGQPQVASIDREKYDFKKLRASVLYNQDSEKVEKRKSHQNPAIIKMYESYIGEPGKGKAHELFHTTYRKR
ncbi:ferredoxin hydrogenase [uncultured Clostridium sp.]|uniref:ferredoxin hydrogenase n=1 Tax=uncultured Clostridium sp. TaxID=59620 RepID=UPI0026168FAF|nr:ferredoxin hydrogenase [uncultured Clostridium sp.]